MDLVAKEHRSVRSSLSPKTQDSFVSIAQNQPQCEDCHVAMGKLSFALIPDRGLLGHEGAPQLLPCSQNPDFIGTTEIM